MERQRIVFIITLLILNACQHRTKRPGNSEVEFEGNYQVIGEDTVWNEYYASGQLRTQVQVNDGKLSGAYLQYTEAGELQISGAMKNGRKFGIWIEYDSSGNPISSIQYDQDSVLYTHDPADLRLSPVTINRADIMIDVPKNWEKINTEPPILLAIRKNCSDPEHSFCPSMTIVSSVESSFEQYVEFVKQQITQSPGFEELHVQSHEETGGKEIFYMIYTEHIDSVRLGSVWVAIQMGDEVYSISGSAENRPIGHYLFHVEVMMKSALSLRSL